ncbi:dispersed gene family protein 1 (DGF-1), partial [Trypanosoma cruzi]
AVPLRLRGGTVDRAITVGRAVDTVLMDGVYVTNGVAVVFDVPAMLPGALRIELRNCVCDGGAQIYVRGYSGEPASDRSLEVSVSGLSGSYCSLVFVHNLPAHTNVTVRDSTIVTAGPMRYSQLSGLTDAVASPLVLHAMSLLQSQLRVSSTVLRSSQAGGTAVYVGGGVDLLSSAVVLDGVSLEASGGPTASAMHVSSSSRLSLRNHSVFSVTNVSVVSSGGGIVLGERLAVFDSVLRFVGVKGSPASPLVRCGGGTVGAGGWLVHRDNEFRTAYVVYVEKYDGVAFRDRSVWSILYNNFTCGSFSSITAYMTSFWFAQDDERPIIYGSRKKKGFFRALHFIDFFCFVSPLFFSFLFF